MYIYIYIYIHVYISIYIDTSSCLVQAPFSTTNGATSSSTYEDLTTFYIY